MEKSIERLSETLQESNRLRLEASNISTELREIGNQIGGDFADELEEIASKIDTACYNLAESVGNFFTAKLSLCCRSVEFDNSKEE